MPPDTPAIDPFDVLVQDGRNALAAGQLRAQLMRRRLARGHAVEATGLATDLGAIEASVARACDILDALHALWATTTARETDAG